MNECRVSNRYNLGFTLVELMVGLAVGLVVVLAAGTLLVFGAQQFQMIIEKNKAEESMLLAAYYTRSIMSQAVNITTTAGPIAAVSATGQILTTYPVGAPVAGSMNTLAVFNREAGINSSVITPTAVFFQEPTGNSSGILYIDLGGAQPMVADPSDLWYDHLVSYNLTSTAIDATTSRATEANITITARYFRSTDKSLWSFAAAPPAGTPPYTDITMDVKVGFRDNILKASLLGDQQLVRLHGPLYYYHLVAPRQF